MTKGAGPKWVGLMTRHVTRLDEEGDWGIFRGSGGLSRGYQNLGGGALRGVVSGGELYKNLKGCFKGRGFKMLEQTWESGAAVRSWAGPLEVVTSSPQEDDDGYRYSSSSLMSMFRSTSAWRRSCSSIS